MTELPGTCSSLRLKKMAEGFLTSLSPCSVIAKTPNSFTAPKRFFCERKVLNRESDSPSSKSEASMACSNTFGPASVPSLVT